MEGRSIAMSMTKKDYQLIADVICGRVENAKLSLHFGYTDEDISHALNTLSDLADMMAYELKLDNSKFDRDKFLSACGVTE